MNISWRDSTSWRQTGLLPRLRLGALVVLLPWLALLGGCASLPDAPRAPVAPSQAFDRPLDTALGRAHAAALQHHPGQSGYRIIDDGASALMTLAALADLAERSIDLKYYIFAADATGHFLLRQLVAAADRGVRVRLLLDDFPLAYDDAALADLAAHPHIEVRLFNPFPTRARWTRPFQLVAHLDRLGRRMHSKLFAVDGQVAVLGGRNIGNHYMEGNGPTNFRDIDILASGPVVANLLKSFDAFWNHPLAVPVEAFATADANAQSPWRSHPAEGETGTEAYGPRIEYATRRAEFVERLLDGTSLIRAHGQAFAELPERETTPAGRAGSRVFRALAQARRDARQEIVYAAAYFVPGNGGVRTLTDLAARGVRVRVLTNSLASTDVVAVHAGYARYRAALLAGGVELFEYRAEARRPAPPGGHRLRPGSSESALHSKAIIYDRHKLWIGSANYDPRSRRLNAELGLLIDSPALAHELLALLEHDLAPEHSWRLALEPADEPGAPPRIVWHGTDGGRPVAHRHEPGARLARHLGMLFFSLLPGIESQI